MPLVMPEHFRRKKYENFCVECAECKRKNRKPCYVRRLSNYLKTLGQGSTLRVICNQIQGEVEN